MSASDPRKPGLVTLPPELFERVAEYTTPRDLTNIRLINREAAEKVKRTYTTVLFSTKSILLCSESSLRDAIDTAKHPVLGAAIKKVRIFIDTLPWDPDEAWGPRVRESLLTRFCTCLETTSPREIAIEVCQLQDNSFPSHIDRSRQAQAIKPPNINFCYEFSTISLALLCTSLLPCELSFGQGEWMMPCSRARLSPPVPQMKQLFSSLKRLSLGTWIDRPLSAARLLGQAIASATQLEYLKLRVVSIWTNHGYDVYKDRDIGEIEPMIEELAKTTFARLHEVHFEGMFCIEETLFDFIRAQPKLKRLSLSSCAIFFDQDEREDWESLSQGILATSTVTEYSADEDTRTWWD